MNMSRVSDGCASVCLNSVIPNFLPCSPFSGAFGVLLRNQSKDGTPIRYRNTAQTSSDYFVLCVRDIPSIIDIEFSTGVLLYGFSLMGFLDGTVQGSALSVGICPSTCFYVEHRVIEDALHVFSYIRFFLACSQVG